MRQTITSKIDELRRARRAIILAHNYQPGEIQDIADFTGDSLELARTAAGTEAETLILCGVYFMAETAAILCPGKSVIIPDEHAGCPMADMITPRELDGFKAEHPGAPVITYVNSTAAVKAGSDVCCTSANAVAVASHFPAGEKLLFVPDRNLGHYAAMRSGRELVLWRGYCPTHQRILPEHVENIMSRHPNAVFVAHPECRPEVVAMAGEVASTTGILKFCRQSAAAEFIIGTEIGLLHRLRKENPGKAFFPASEVADCANMKLITLEKILWALEDMAPRVEVGKEIAGQARAAIEKMLAISGVGGQART